MKELICIVCPKGCHLQVDEQNDYQVFGNSCPRGAEYGKNELLHPTRVLTSIVNRRCGRKQCVRYRGGLDRAEKCLRYKRIKSWKTVVLSCNKTRSTLKGRYIEVCMLLFFVWELEYGTETLPHRNINYSICTKNNFKII